MSVDQPLGCKDHGRIGKLLEPVCRFARDIVFYECEGGGAVFSTGSISWAASLSANKYKNNVSQITENVLNRFLDLKPFVLPKG